MIWLRVFSILTFVATLYGAEMSRNKNIESPVCSICHHIVSSFQKSVPAGPTIKLIQEVGVPYCLKHYDYDREVCKGAIAAMTPFILRSAWRHYTNPHAVCSSLKLCKQEYRKQTLEQEISRILSGKPIDKKWEKPTRRKVIKIMHITDLHPDLFYSVGAEADCGEPVCCRAANLSLSEAWGRISGGEVLTHEGPAIKKPAGYWGSIAQCELPFQTFELFLNDLKKLSPELDLILWTGDNTPHDIWKQTQDYNLNYTSILAQKIKDNTQVRVVAAMGNHESWPVNVYDFRSDRQNMLNTGLANAWRDWLDEEAYQMLRTKGYFALTIPSMNNLRVLSLNTQAGNPQNWFLLQDPTDPGSQLKWVENELKRAEKEGYFVWIIGHVHPKSTTNEWIMRYNALVDRYSYVIRAQFFGHSHVDHIAFFPTFKDPKQLASYHMISPSLTTSSFLNPEYRVLEIDYDTLQVLDYHQYMLNLSTNPKKEDNPQFQLFYSFKNAYNLTNMELDGGLTELRTKLEQDKNYQILYSYLMNGGLEPGKSGRGVFCDTTTSPQWHAECMGTTYKPSKLEQMAGPWKELLHSDK